MATQVQIRRGTTAEHGTFTGAVGELTVDTDKDVVVVHDGATAGGRPMLRENGSQNLVTTGTATAASFIPTSSTVPTNGVYLPAANSVALATNGAGRLFVDSSGNVGVGTGTPTGASGSRVVEIYSSGTLSELHLTNSTSTNSGLRGLTHLLNGADAYAYNREAGSYIFGTNNTERLRITSAGLVGVGTSSPGSILHCNYSTATDTYVRTSNSAASSGFDVGVSSGGVAYLFNRNNTDIRLGTNSQERVTITSGGLVGIGSTSPTAALTFSTAVDAVASTPDKIRLYDDGTNIYGFGVAGSARLNYCAPAAANHVWHRGTTESARIDSSGRLLVGTSSAFTPVNPTTLQVAGGGIGIGTYVGASSGTYTFEFLKSRSSTVGGTTIVAASDILGQITFNGTDGTQAVQAALIKAEVDGTPGSTVMPGRLVFSTTSTTPNASPTERVNISSAGTLSALNGDVGIRSISTAGAGTSVTIFRGSHSGYGFSGLGVGTECIYIWSNGNVQNTNNSYGAISDAKLKENIVDAGSQWDDLKALQVRKYNFKEESGQQTHTQIGLVAQEVELVSPGLVSESPDRDKDGNDLGTVTKSVNYSVLYMKAVKALQEAMERIETLEAKVAALEGA